MNHAQNCLSNENITRKINQFYFFGDVVKEIKNIVLYKNLNSFSAHFSETKAV